MTDGPPEEPKEPPRNDPPRRQDGPRAVQHVEVEAWNGPFPPPAVIREIDDIVPGAAKQIIDQFVTEGDHRRQMQTRSQTLPFIDQIVARALGLMFAAGCLVLIGYAINKGAEWAAGLLSVAMVVGGINAIMRRQ